MDRYDEKKDRADEVAERDVTREGDVLGLSGIEVPKEPGDPSTEQDAQSIAQRRARALSEEQSATTPVDPSNQGGATGIDMGAGGQGTLRRRSSE